MFIEQHLDVVVTVGMGVGTWLISIGYFKAQVKNLEERLAKMEAQGSSFAREAVGQQNIQIKNLEQRVDSVESINDKTTAMLTEIHAAVKVIEAKLIFAIKQ